MLEDLSVDRAKQLASLIVLIEGPSREHLLPILLNENPVLLVVLVQQGVPPFREVDLAKVEFQLVDALTDGPVAVAVQGVILADDLRVEVHRLGPDLGQLSLLKDLHVEVSGV